MEHTNMFHWRFLILICGIAAIITACADAQIEQDRTQPIATQEFDNIRLSMGFIPNVQYAPFYVAVDKGYYLENGIEVEFDYSLETDGVTLVGIGLPGLFGANYIGLRALLNEAGLGEDDVILDSIGFNQVEALATDQDQAVVIYANNEPIQLDALGYEIDLIQVADYVQLASNGLISNEKTISENPDLVRRMVEASLRGLADTLDNPDEAFEISKKYVENLDQADQSVQREVLTASLLFWQTDRLGYSNAAAWENMQSILLDMGLLSQPLNIDQAYTNEFVE
jgi:NitT/TauT family transport system substrate-binding protein